MQQGFLAEAVLVLTFGLFKLRGRLLAPWVVPHLTRRRTLAAYAVVLAVIGGSILVPKDADGVRIPVDLGAGSRFDALKVDSVLLADLLDRGLKGVTLLTSAAAEGGRQLRPDGLAESRCAGASAAETWSRRDDDHGIQ